MGQSTDAILFYGYCWSSDGVQLIDESFDGDWEDAYVHALGFPEPDDAADQDTYWRKRIRLAARCPVEIDSHCSLDCPMPFIAIKKSLTRSWRGSMSKIKSLAIGKGWNKQLRDFNNLMGINVGNKKPAWWLVSNWS